MSVERSPKILSREEKATTTIIGEKKSARTERRSGRWGEGGNHVWSGSQGCVESSNLRKFPSRGLTFSLPFFFFFSRFTMSGKRLSPVI